MEAQTLIALAGISGTLGAGLGGTYLGAHMDRRAEARREDAATERAARLIDADLMLAETAARMCVKQGKWWVSDRRLIADAWQQYRDAIASKLSWGHWVAVMVAVEAVGDLQGSRDGARKVQLAEMATNTETRDVIASAEALDLDIADPAPDIPKSTVTQIRPMLVDIEAGRTALAPLARREPWVNRP